MNTSTILLVDDDEVLRQVLRRVLTRDGFAVIEAGSVAEALERAHEQRPALALIDLRLPDGDGVEVAQQLANQIGSFPLILMTAYPLRLRDQPELARGFKHVLTKPLNLDELRQAIESSLGSAPVPPPPSEPRPSGSVPVASTPGVYRSLTVTAPAPKKHHRLRWTIISAAVVAVVAAAVALPALGTPGLAAFLQSSNRSGRRSDHRVACSPRLRPR